MDVTIDFSAVTGKADFHAAFAEALSFPGWYGANLDALHDCLTDIGTETHLRLLRWDAPEAALGAYAAGAKRVILHAASVNPRLAVTFEN